MRVRSPVRVRTSCTTVYTTRCARQHGDSELDVTPFVNTRTHALARKQPWILGYAQHRVLLEQYNVWVHLHCTPYKRCPHVSACMARKPRKRQGDVDSPEQASGQSHVQNAILNLE